MKKITYILLFLSITVTSALYSQTCNNIPETTNGANVVPAFAAGSNNNLMTISFTADGVLPVLSAVTTLWLRVPNEGGNLQVPIISNNTLTNIGFAQAIPSADLGLPGNDAYYFFTSVIPIGNIAASFPNGVAVNICTISFPIPVPGVEIINTELLPPFDPGGGYIYYETALHGCTTLEDNFVSVDLNISLPIKIKVFTAEKFNDERASNLRWTSSTEVNASHFEVERSSDGFIFEYIDQVTAAGNSNIEQHYALIDRTIPTTRNKQDVYYYRLKLVDLDGSFEYTDVRSVRFDDDANVTFNAYPNPTTSKLYINMSTPAYDETQFTQANVFDLSGKLAYKQNVSTKGITELDLDQLTNGAYNLIIVHNGKTYQNRLIKTN